MKPRRFRRIDTEYSAARVALGVVIAVNVAAGCTGPQDASSKNHELSFAAQVAELREGSGDTIQVEETALRDSDLRTLSNAVSVRVLLLDHPAGEFSAAGLASLVSLPALEHLRVRGRGIDD